MGRAAHALGRGAYPGYWWVRRACVSTLHCFIIEDLRELRALRRYFVDRQHERVLR